MAKIIFGNHSALRVQREQRKRIREFYLDVLGCKLMREFDGKDDIRIGSDFYISFLYSKGDGRGANQGVNYAAESPLTDDELLKAIFLELKTENVEKMRKKIIDFGVRVIEVPDPHLYFQAPGGQVFRLVGMDEDLSKYERT